MAAWPTEVPQGDSFQKMNPLFIFDIGQPADATAQSQGDCATGCYVVGRTRASSRLLHITPTLSGTALQVPGVQPSHLQPEGNATAMFSSPNSQQVKWQQQWRFQVTSWAHGPGSSISGGPSPWAAQGCSLDSSMLLCPPRLYFRLYLVPVAAAVSLVLPLRQAGTLLHSSHLSITR